MWFRKKRTLLAVLTLISLFTLSSCTKNSTSNKDDNANNEKTALSDSNYKETNEDLLTVDYKQFYDELAPHGDWVQVSAKDLGIDLKKEKSAGDNSFLLNDLIGIKEAYADDFDFGMFFVWRPSPELAVSVSAGEPPVYMPYSRGQWIYTDAGWYFRAPTPYEEITVHYGRWVFSPAVGWVWVPGRVWAPAWVEWYDDDDYIGWAPLPPCTYIVDDGIAPVFIDNDRFIFCERNYFVDPDVYRHCYFYRDNPDRFNIRIMNKVDGVMIRNNVVVNKGPDVDGIEKITGKKIDHVKVNRVDNIRNAKFSGGEVNSYSPHFTKVNGNDRKESVTKPNNFVSFDHAESKHKNEMTRKNAGSNDNKALRDNGSAKDNKSNKESINGNNRQSDKQMSKGNSKNNYNQKDNNSGNQMKEFRRKTKDNNSSNKQKQYKSSGKNKGNQQQKQDNQPKGNDKGSQKQYKSKNNSRNNNDTYQKGNTKQRNNGNKSRTNKHNDTYNSGNEKNSNQSQGNGHGRGKH